MYMKNVEKNDLQLTLSVMPSKQFIRLQPFYDGLKMTKGYTDITAQAVEEASTITLHTAGLTVDESTILV